MENKLTWKFDEEEKKEYDRQIDYFYKSALAIAKSGKLFGRAIDTENPKEVIAVFYLMYLNSSVMYKENINELLYEEAI